MMHARVASALVFFGILAAEASVPSFAPARYLVFLGSLALFVLHRQYRISKRLGKVLPYEPPSSSPVTSAGEVIFQASAIATTPAREWSVAKEIVLPAPLASEPSTPVKILEPASSAGATSPLSPNLGATSLTAAEKSALDSLRLRIPELSEPWVANCDEATLLRFLRGHDLKVDVALSFLKGAAEWRRSFGTNSLVAEWEADQSEQAMVLKRTWPFGIIGKDPVGRPVQLFRLVMTDFPGYIEKVGMESILRHNVWRFERNLLDGNGNGEAIIIMDLGFSDDDVNRPITSLYTMRVWINGLMAYLKALTGIADPHYPETYSTIIFTRAPGPFWAVWKVAQLLVNENTRRKVKILTSSDPKPKLLDMLPPDCIPTIFGGTASVEHIPKGGCLTL